MAGSNARSPQPPRNTGPIELRDLGPNGRPLGTRDDCYDGSPWELHRGELVRQVSGNFTHGQISLALGALFNTHALAGYAVCHDVYCELSDGQETSLRAPDLVVAKHVPRECDGPLLHVPILAVEVRATQSKKRLEEKLQLYLEHDWPEIWCIHTDRHEVEIVRKGMASVVYRPGAQVPLPPVLHKYGLTAIPVSAIFDVETKLEQYNEGWVKKIAQAQTRSSVLLETLLMRGIDVSADTRSRISACLDLETLQRWFKLAMTAPDARAFVSAMD